MTEPQTDRQAGIDRAATGARNDRGHRLLAVLVAVAILGLAVVAVGMLALAARASDLAAQQSAAANAAQQLARQVRGLGATPVVTAPTAVQGVPGPSGAQGPAPTQQQIDASVSRWLDAHPAPGATPAMVAVQVAEYLTAHPPVTQEEIATAASDYLAAHAGQFQGATGSAGQPGRNGTDGQNATDAQVSSAVDAYCASHNGCTGPAGATGAQGDQGVSMTDLQFARDSSGQCQAVATLHDPATGRDWTVTHPAGDAACPLIPATTTAPTALHTHGR